MQPPWAAKAVRDCGEPLNLAEDVRCGGGAEVRPGKGAGLAGAGPAGAGAQVTARCTGWLAAWSLAPTPTGWVAAEIGILFIVLHFMMLPWGHNVCTYYGQGMGRLARV